MKNVNQDPRQAVQCTEIPVTAEPFDDCRFSYLRPNRYFKFYLFRAREGDQTCWLPEGFSA